MNNGLIITWIGTSALAIFLTAIILIANMPYNPMKDQIKETSIVSLMPEAWSFFTRSPREPQLYMYKEISGSIQEVSYSNPSIHSWFGLKRNIRIQGIELGNVFERSQNLKWYDCQSAIGDCQEWDSIPAQEVTNIAQIKSICGEYYLVHKELVPWAWAKSSDEVNMPAKVTKINVLCFDQ